MSMCLGRRRGLEGNADASSRWRLRVDAHESGPREVRTRVIRDAREAALGNRRREFLQMLSRLRALLCNSGDRHGDERSHRTARVGTAPAW